MPRRIEIDQRVPGDPDEVAARLSENTRLSLTPYRGGPFTLGRKPLKGTVGKRTFRVGLNRRDWWSFLQPTARAALEETPTGTRVHGEVGMPGWLVWLLRGVVVAGIPTAVGASTLALLADGSPGNLAIAAGCAGFSALIGVFGTGAHVHHADSQVDALRDAVVAAAGGAAVAAGGAEQEREAEAASAVPPRTRA